MAELLLLQDICISGDGFDQIKQAIYICSDETECDGLAADFTNNGFPNPANTDDVLTNYEMYLLKQFGRFLVFIIFHVPLP